MIFEYDLAPLLLPMGACAFACGAAWVDCRERRIPNRLVLAGLAVALVGQLTLNGMSGLGLALGGVALGLALMLPFYALGAMGAGDAKLVGMIGAFVGPWGVLSVTVLTFLAGGVLAIAVALRNRALGRTLDNVKTMLVGSLVSAAALGKAEVAAPVVSAGKLPYGVAIAVGIVTYTVMSFMQIEIF